jgi:hypothetical protein
MSVSLPHPSSRLLRAAAAEQADLARHRGRLADRREALLAELRQVDDAMAVVDDRLAMLERLAGPPAPDDALHDRAAQRRPSQAPAARQPPDAEAQPPNPARQILRGPAIRQTAVRVVIARPQRIEALHYREWYELLQEAGYAVAGKDPVAVFLTQVSRSPVVRKATKPGVYEVDRQAPLRIRQRLDRLQSELRDLAAAPSAPIDLPAVRARRHELDLEISQHERALEEALRVLSRDEAYSASAVATP